jgi:hypothetical protein
MGQRRYPSGPEPAPAVYSDKLKQVEPDFGAEFVVRPQSLTANELGWLPVKMAPEPMHVRVWVRYGDIAEQVHGLALAWTPRAVYVEWEDRGIHRIWVWASAVERASTDDAAKEASKPSDAAPQPEKQQAITVLDTQSLVDLVNDQLALLGTTFKTAMAKPTGPFSAVVFGSIEDHAVRLEFFGAAKTDKCSVHLFDMTTKEVLAERVEAKTLPASIEAYPWESALTALDLDLEDLGEGLYFGM